VQCGGSAEEYNREAYGGTEPEWPVDDSRSGGATDGPALSGGALPQRHSSASNGQPAVDPVHASIQPSMLILARQKGKPSMCLVWTKKFGVSQRATQKFLSFSFPSVASLNFDCEFR
jgi:hypothetical protein